VPEHYLPQIQLLLEILDFENCDFVQYKPETIKFVKTKGPCEESGNIPCPAEETVPEIFMITRVTRDRAWFDQHLKTMQVFWDRVESARKNGLCEVVWEEIHCEVVEDECQDCSEPWVQVPAQAQVLCVQGVPREFLCEVHSA